MIHLNVRKIVATGIEGLPFTGLQEIYDNGSLHPLSDSPFLGSSVLFEDLTSVLFEDLTDLIFN